MKECLFCQIIEGEKPSHKIYEDEDTYAFLDINPRTRGHALVIPKVHRETYLDLHPHEIHSLFESVQKVAKAIKKSTKSKGFNILQNNKKVAGQVIDHVHVHIIPRNPQDNFKIKWNYEPKEKELQKIKTKIKKKL